MPHLKSLLLPLLCVSLSLTGLSTQAQQAQTPDEEQPIHITADSLDIQDLKGISIYTGKVEVIQGSLTLKGDKMTIHHPQREVEWIEVDGAPATFKRFDTQEQSWIKGRANRIDYRAAEKTVLLTGDAKVEQPGKNLITGPELFYDMQNKTLQANSTPEEKKRVSVTLMPEKKVENPPK
ncbi:MAG: lipopolysaccharide transport periplasmic protein LptA [Thiomicrorhabdus chilensis]|uniref:lipopolysaccharide transport periplasmic protein LptA n=1 Tax=Thiomicrorhabdus chilensis TaxID=63656 RepID=UPI00299D5841|nr:lipopolysaccharide transport periplasmic protein LptA [Thiomicrorhabdus chilensis]MDX1347384.1 lipopolysaccharide transport periplasmic protein LptA [Thiomicrorhabdus chilensis]